MNGRWAMLGSVRARCSRNETVGRLSSNSLVPQMLRSIFGGSSSPPDPLLPLAPPPSQAGIIGVEALGYGNWLDAAEWPVSGAPITYFGNPVRAE